MPPFSYASLPPVDSSTIRLLSLIPNRDETAALQGQLHNYSLQESGKESHLYEALSYVWGSFDDPPHFIYINGNSLSITANLHAALRHLRNQNLERVIWVDALCINQQDDQEKGLQIQLMARIYGQANRVIVYFGEAADDSDMAFESIRAAADDENEKPTGPLAIRDSDEPILELLKRPWFQRIWILQEVGLARSILIICGSAEMNGYTFCSGVSKLESLLNGYSDLKSWILPTIRLIRRSIFRPKYNSSALGDLSLGELIDMYHNHKATVRHDKVYALLGMCSDQLSSPELLPDYTISWETLFRRLVKFILHKSVPVDVWDDREAAVIKSSGHVLGHVSSIRNGINRYPAQYIEVTFNDRPLSLQYYKNYGAHWTLQASATSIRKNDIVCLLDGASNPTIMRASEDHFGIIMIAVTLRQQTHKHTSFQLSMSSTPDYSHDFLLVWQWGSMPAQHSLAPQLPQIEINSLVPDYLKTNAIKSMRSFEVALILKDTGDHVMVEAKLKKDIKKYGKLFGIDNIHILSLQEALASVYWSSNRWKMAENLLLEVITTRQDLQGKCHQDTLNSKMGLARAYIDEEVLSRPSRAEELRGFRTELLNGIRSNSRIEEKIMILVVEYLDGRMLKLLLGLGRDSVSVTEKLAKAIFRPERGDGKILILLEERGIDGEITEDMIHFIAKNFGLIAMKSLIQNRGADVQYTRELLLDGRGVDMFVDNKLLTILARLHYPDITVIIELILQKQGAYMAITEEIMIAAVGNIYYGEEIIRQLFAKQGASIVITEEIMIAAVGNEGCGANIIKQLFAKSEANIVITEEIVITATKNPFYGANIIEQLFAKPGANKVITEEIIITVCSTQSHYGVPGIVKALLEMRGTSMVITEEIVIAAMNERHGASIIKQFTNSGVNIVITEEIMIAAVGSKYQRREIIRVLLETGGADVNITPEVIKAVSKNRRDIFKDLRPKLEPHDDTKIKRRRKEGMMRLFEDELKDDIMMQLFEKRGADMEVTEEIVKMAISATPFAIRALILLFKKQGEKLRVTEEMVRIVEGEFPPEFDCQPALLEIVKDNIQKYSSSST